MREAEAEALLALRRPQDARLAFEEVLLADPTSRNALIGRFYALVEEERFFAAFQQVDQIAAKEKPGIREPKQRQMQPNTRWLQAKLLSAQVRSFAEMPGAAWKMMRPLTDHAPANPELRRVLGDIA